MLTVTDTKTGSVLEFVANRVLAFGTESLRALNGTLSGTYKVLQNGKQTPMQAMTRADAEKAIAKMRAAGLVVAGELEG